jgi:hypothetical protein
MKLVILGLVSASLVGVGTAEAHQGRAHYNAAANTARPYVTQAPAGYAGNPHAYSRAQSWYSDTGWQPGTSAIISHGYAYGYGGAGQHPPIIVAAPYQGAYYGPAIHQVQRSQPFGYVVDGYGRYPWSRQPVYGYGQYQGQYQEGHQGHHQTQNCPCPHHGQAQAPSPVHYQSAAPLYVTQPPIHVQAPPVYVQGAQVHVQAPPVHVAAPTVEVTPSQIHYDQGYFAAPAPAAPAPTPPSPTERPYTQEPGERG